MSFADTNGQHLYYEDTGWDGPAVIFSHGFLMDHDMFAPQVDALRDRYRVITWDERGTARRPARVHSTTGTRRATSWPYSRIWHRRGGVGGMSQGGFLSLRAALLSPERVRALVLIDTQAGLEDPESVPALWAGHEEWMANGPGAVQESVAASILGADVDPSPWYAKWRRCPGRA